MKDPTSPEEWAEAMAAAVFSISLDAAIGYGLVQFVDANEQPLTFGPDIDVQRAETILSAGVELGYPLPTLEQIIEADAAPDPTKD